MGHQCSFPTCRYFLSKRATTFLIKSRSSVLHYIFKKIFALITVSSKKNLEILTRYRREILYWKCMSPTFRFINYLYCWIYCSYILHKTKNCSGTKLTFCFILKLKITVLFALIRFRSLYHSLTFAVAHCHLSSHVVIRCHSFSLVLALAVTCCHSMYHSSVFS